MYQKALNTLQATITQCRYTIQVIDRDHYRDTIIQRLPVQYLSPLSISESHTTNTKYPVQATYFSFLHITVFFVVFFFNIFIFYLQSNHFSVCYVCILFMMPIYNQILIITQSLLKFYIFFFYRFNKKWTFWHKVEAGFSQL